MGKKYTFEHVKQYFEDKNCELLEKEYIKAINPMRYKCECGNISNISFSKFQQGQRCKKCRGSEKFTFEYVKQYFKNQGCELLEKEYINCDTKMKYKCSCDNISIITFMNFKRGQRCQECKKIKIGNAKRKSYKYIYKIFKDQGCELLEKEYKNDSTKMKYKCCCGNISAITFNNFRSGYRCSKCGNNEKLTFEEVQQYFKNQGCELLEKEYINNKTKIKYKCSCGNISKMKFSHFKQGHRCRICFNRGFSKESQTLFNAIYNKIKKHKKRIYFATLNHEFGIKFQKKYFKFDYVDSNLKKAIEYNGAAFHPQSHQKNEEIGWFVFNKNKTVKEARDYEKIKYEGLKKRGYQILTVWDYELHKDFDNLVQKCLNFLTS